MSGDANPGFHFSCLIAWRQALHSAAHEVNHCDVDMVADGSAVGRGEALSFSPSMGTSG